MAAAPITLVEVAARDGLQSDPADLATADKAELIRRCAAAGLRRIEAVSFANPARVPKMADWATLMSMLDAPGFLPDRRAVSLIGLVLNERGLQQAIDAGVDEVNFVVVCSDTFALKNQGRDTAGLLQQWYSIAGPARQAGLFTTVTLSAAFGCPYEGEVPLTRLRWVLDQLAGAQPDHLPDEVGLADSIGVAAPTDVRERVSLLAEVAPQVARRCHFHNTRNTGLANVVAAVEAGVGAIDASLGGIGGCPFAPNATGNVPTEDVAYLLQRMGHDTGVDLDALSDAVGWLEATLGHPVPGLLSKAGSFPRRDQRLAAAGS
jgi:hydroxymethylglutaryl-CoA lyase